MSESVPILGGSPSQADRDRLPIGLGVEHPDAADYCLDDVRARFLEIIRARALGHKAVRVDVAPVLMPMPKGLQAQLLLMVSLPSPMLGDRLMASAAVDTLEPKDDVLSTLGEQLYNSLMDHRAQLLAQSKLAPAPGQPGQ